MTDLYLFRSVNLLRTGIIIWICGCLDHSASAQLRMSEVIDQSGFILMVLDKTVDQFINHSPAGNLWLIPPIKTLLP